MYNQVIFESSVENVEEYQFPREFDILYAFKVTRDVEYYIYFRNDPKNVIASGVAHANKIVNFTDLCGYVKFNSEFDGRGPHVIGYPLVAISHDAICVKFSDPIDYIYRYGVNYWNDERRVIASRTGKFTICDKTFSYRDGKPFQGEYVPEAQPSRTCAVC